MSTGCIFCSIVEGKQEATVIYQDESVLVFEDINPQAPEHLLAVPREHIPSVNELQEEHEVLVGHLHTVIKSIASDRGFDDTGYRLVINCGDNALQSVDHLHLHCLAGREMDWPPG